MSTSKDLTRWNRAGLSRFRYIDGNAATYLEQLRRQLVARFTDTQTGELQWTDLARQISGDETTREWLERLLAQYHGERKDYAWEIARTLARSVHVLTEYLDTYANEGYLRTATQWDAVRKLVAMLDYSPAPPASAATELVVLTKADESGTLEKGFQVKNAPQEGAPAIFETLANLELDTALNVLRIKDWDKSQLPFDYVPSGDGDLYEAGFHVETVAEGISEGSRGILMVDDQGLAVKVNGINGDVLTLLGEAPSGNIPLHVFRHQVSLLLLPDLIQSPRLTGDDVVRLSQTVSVTVGSAVAWQESGVWYAAIVDAVDGDRIALRGGQAGHATPSQNVSLYRLTLAHSQSIDGVNRVVLPLQTQRKTATVWAGASGLQTIATNKIDSYSSGGGDAVFDRVNDSSIGNAFYLDGAAEAIGTVIEQGIQRLDFDGDAGDLASGQWLVVINDFGDAVARKIVTLDQSEGRFSITLDSPGVSGNVATVYGLFTETLRPADYDINQQAVSGAEVPLAELPPVLKKGRRLIVSNGKQALAVRVTGIDTATATITVTPPIPCHADDAAATSESCDFVRHDTVVYANVVKAGHGERKPTKILGSGNAVESNQTFNFAVDAVSFVADTTQPSGVRADIDVTVDGRTWKQVATLNDSSPTDPHYTVRMTEEGYIKIGCGDGKHGRRLPSGTNNVRISYRKGTGRDGNLDANELTETVNPHPLVEGVLQPLATTGGNAMESATQLRDNAPASVLTLERAVSLADFTHLASRYASVWQARAFAQRTGFARHESINVVVVPAGGGELGVIEQDLTNYLRDHAVPGVQIQVTRYRPVILDVTVSVRVNFEEYEADTVIEAVRQALYDAFALSRRQLAQSLFRSDLFRYVEAVIGVENATCVIKPVETTLRRVSTASDGTIRSLVPMDDQVIFIDPVESVVEVTAEAFSL